jgi:hypothetical protein
VITINYWFFGIIMVFNVWVVIALCIYIIRPLETRWAIIQARKMVAEGRVRNDWMFRNVYRTLAIAKNDQEASKLWETLDRMK